MPKRLYVLALVCYLSIPVILTAGAQVHHHIDPEMTRGHANYERNFQLLQRVRLGALIAAAGLSLVLCSSCCTLVLKSRRRSLGWLPLAAAGPVGFGVIAALADRSPAPGDLHDRFIRNLRITWRVPFESALLVGVWTLAYQSVAFKRELMILVESFMTGTPTSTIIAVQTASSGMWAFSEGMEELFLVGLLYLLRPIAFNLAGHLFTSRSRARRQESAPSGG